MAGGYGDGRCFHDRRVTSRRGFRTTGRACAGLLAQRWRDGFRCPQCGHHRGWELDRGVVLIECATCHRQTSVTALHRSHLPLKVWFMASWFVATRRNGISTRQLWL
jgi:hypothetical protein